MTQQIKKKFLSPEVIDYFDNQIDAAEQGVLEEKARAEGQESAIRSEFSSADEAKLLEAKQFSQDQDALKLAEAKEYAELKVAEAKSEIMGGIPSATLDTITEIAEALASEQTATGAILTKLSELEAADAAEVLARDAAISVAVMAEQQAREAFDGLLQSSLEQEIADREEVDEELSQRIDSTATSLMGTIGAVNDRAIAAEQELQSQITSNFESLENNIADVEENLSGMIAQELVERQSGDDALDARITTLEGQVGEDLQAAISALESDILAEEEARIAADLVLDGKIETEKGRIDAILSASEADKDTFAEIVALINSVDTENDQAFAGYASANDARVGLVESGLAQEVLDRQAADNLKESLSNKSTDSNLGNSDTLYPTQKAVKDHVVASQLAQSRSLLTGEGLESLVPADINPETADRHYSGGVAHPLNPGYICYFTDQSYVFVDARNPYAMNIYKTLTFSTAANNFPQCMVAIGNYVLVAMSNGRVYTIDWTDINNPSIFGFKTIGTGQHFDMATDGSNSLFLANTNNNCVYAVDITDKTNPTLINSVALGGFGTGVAFNSGYVYVTNYSNKLHTIQKNATTNLWEQVSVINTIATPNRCRVVQNSMGEKILFAMKYNGTDACFYNISVASAPVEAKRLVTSSPMQIYAVPFAHNDIVHVGFDNGTVGGFSIVDILDPKFAGSFTPANADGSKKFSSMRVLIKTSTKSPYFKEKSILLASGVRTGGSSSQKTTAQVQLPIINHDSVELLARPTTSYVTSSVASEAQTRSDADQALSSRISALEGAADGPSFYSGSIVVGEELGFIELDRQYIKLMSCSVGRLAVHEGEDYTVSVVEGKTRLTWIGSLVNPGGAEAIDSGDKIFFVGAY
jgi:hypothetical protein